MLINKYQGGDNMPRPSNPDRVVTQLRINYDKLDKVRVLAKNDNRSLNMMLCTIIESYLEQYEKKHGKIKIDE